MASVRSELEQELADVYSHANATALAAEARHATTAADILEDERDAAVASSIDADNAHTAAMARLRRDEAARFTELIDISERARTLAADRASAAAGMIDML